MTLTVVVAATDRGVAEAVESLLADEATVAVRAVADTPAALLAAVLDHEPDCVLLHEGFGPAPALAVARDLVGRLPWVSIVLLVQDVTPDLYGAATDHGIRSLVALPASLADLTARVAAAAWWSRAVRVGSEARSADGEQGILLAVAGAKGGVGTTSLALQLAFSAAALPERRVCLVDLDLFGADVASFLGATPSHTLLDLVDLADELSAGLVQPVLYPHETGVRVLFPPEDVIDAELVTPSLVRRTLAVLRTMFDIVVVDCGSRVGEASLPAVELADRVALVCTADLLAVRQAHRMADTWVRLDVRAAESPELVLTRVARNGVVPPSLVARISTMPVCRPVVPDAPDVFEAHANERAAPVLTQRRLADPVNALAVHFGLRPVVARQFTPLWRWRRALPGAGGRPGDRSPNPGTAPAPQRAAGEVGGANEPATTARGTP